MKWWATRTRLIVGAVWKLVAQNFCDPLVKDLPTALEKALVGHVLDERVFEYVGRLRRRAARENEPGRFQSPKRLRQGRPLDRRNGFQQPEGELTTDRRADLRDLFDRRESVKPGHRQILERRGDRERRQSGSEHIGAALLAKEAGLREPSSSIPR